MKITVVDESLKRGPSARGVIDVHLTVRGASIGGRERENHAQQQQQQQQQQQRRGRWSSPRVLVASFHAVDGRRDEIFLNAAWRVRHCSLRTRSPLAVSPILFVFFAFFLFSSLPDYLGFAAKEAPSVGPFLTHTPCFDVGDLRHRTQRWRGSNPVTVDSSRQCYRPRCLTSSFSPPVHIQWIRSGSHSTPIRTSTWFRTRPVGPFGQPMSTVTGSSPVSVDSTGTCPFFEVSYPRNLFWSKLIKFSCFPKSSNLLEHTTHR